MGKFKDFFIKEVPEETQDYDYADEDIEENQNLLRLISQKLQKII